MQIEFFNLQILFENYALTFSTILTIFSHLFLLIENFDQILLIKCLSIILLKKSKQYICCIKFFYNLLKLLLFINNNNFEKL